MKKENLKICWLRLIEFIFFKLENYKGGGLLQKHNLLKEKEKYKQRGVMYLNF